MRLPVLKKPVYKTNKIRVLKSWLYGLPPKLWASTLLCLLEDHRTWSVLRYFFPTHGAIFCQSPYHSCMAYIYIYTYMCSIFVVNVDRVWMAFVIILLPPRSRIQMICFLKFVRLQKKTEKPFDTEPLGRWRFLIFSSNFHHPNHELFQPHEVSTTYQLDQVSKFFAWDPNDSWA